MVSWPDDEPLGMVAPKRNAPMLRPCRRGAKSSPRRDCSSGFRRSRIQFSKTALEPVLNHVAVDAEDALIAALKVSCGLWDQERNGSRASIGRIRRRTGSGPAANRCRRGFFDLRRLTVPPA